MGKINTISYGEPCVEHSALVMLSFSVVPRPGCQDQGACWVLLAECTAAGMGVHCGPPASTPPLSHFSGSVVLPCCWAWTLEGSSWSVPIVSLILNF